MLCIGRCPVGNSFMIRFWVARPLRTFHVILAIAAVAMEVVSRISGMTWLSPAAELVLLFGILHFFLHTSFRRRYTFFLDNQRTYSLPAKKIGRISWGYLTLFMLFLCVGMAVAREVYDGTLLEKLRLVILYLLQAVLGALFASNGLGEDELLISNSQGLLDALGEVAPKEQQPWEALASQVQTVLVLLGLALLAVLAVAAVVRLAARALSQVRSGGEDMRLRETRDKESRMTRKQRDRDRITDRSPAGRVRRCYRRYVDRNRRRGQAIPAWMTPAEIQNALAAPGENGSALQELYEKARYSRYGCTEEEARQAKILERR